MKPMKFEQSNGEMMTSAQAEIYRAKELFNKKHKKECPDKVEFRGKVHKVIDGECYQGLVIFNLDDNGSILRADSGLCRKADAPDTIEELQVRLLQSQRLTEALAKMLRTASRSSETVKEIIERVKEEIQR